MIHHHPRIISFPNRIQQVLLVLVIVIITYWTDNNNIISSSLVNATSSSSSSSSTFRLQPQQFALSSSSSISTFGRRNNRRRGSLSSTSTTTVTNNGLQFLSNQPPNQQQQWNDNNDNNNDNNNNIRDITLCSAAASVPVQRSIIKTLLRGSLLRITSDLSGGTPLESIKCRVTITNEGPWEATRNIIHEQGIWGLYTGTPSRTVEGALIGAVFMLGSVVTKRQLRAMGCPPTISALAGGLVGGVAQSIVMTPAGMIFTALSSANQNNQDPKKPKETSISICQRVIAEKGIGGMYIGIGPMCLRQATNWASRSGFTEIARSTLGLTKYGLYGELLSGIIGGVGSCWNTPIETIRVFAQRDVSIGKNPLSMSQYWTSIVEESGYPGLFRGVTPRAIQAIWQTTFLVVVPNLMGL